MCSQSESCGFPSTSSDQLSVLVREPEINVIELDVVIVLVSCKKVAPTQIHVSQSGGISDMKIVQ